MSDPKAPTGSDSAEPAQAPPKESEAAGEPAPGASASEPAPGPGAASEPAPSAATEESARRKKRKKKKKSEAAEATATGPVRAELDVRGRERPKFLLLFPQDPELEPLIAAFEAGNFFKLREEAPRVIERTARPEVKQAAEELLRRTEPDPLIKFFLGAAVALFVAIVGYVYYAHG